MRHTFSLVCAGLLALTLLAGCEKTTAPKTVRAPLSVETLTVEAADQPRWITLLGQAEGGREVEVKSQVSGILKKVAFTEGAEVKAGDVLYQIDPAPFEARLKSAAANTRSAKATLAEAKTSYERTRALFEKGAKSRQDLDEANRAHLVASSAYNAATASERDAAISLEWTTVRAPASGLMSDTQFNEGSLISSASSVLATITQHDDVRVVFAPSARALDGADVTTDNAVKLRDERGRTLSGKLDYVAQSVNPKTSTRLNALGSMKAPDFFPATSCTWTFRSAYEKTPCASRRRPCAKNPTALTRSSCTRTAKPGSGPSSSTAGTVPTGSPPRASPRATA